MPLAPVQLNVERVLVDQDATQLLNRPHHRKLLPLQRRLAHPLNALIRINLHKNIVAVAKIDHKGLDVSDFHGYCRVVA